MWQYSHSVLGGCTDPFEERFEQVFSMRKASTRAGGCTSINAGLGNIKQIKAIISVGCVLIPDVIPKKGSKA
jgi:hypothetical protein